MAGAIVTGGIVVVAAWHVEVPPQVDTRGSILTSGTVVPALVRRETRPTLDPAEFTGKAALAYQIAREIPDVLDQLDCYCECDKFLDHKNLLSCYIDYHAAT